MGQEVKVLAEEKSFKFVEDKICLYKTKFSLNYLDNLWYYIIE